MLTDRISFPYIGTYSVSKFAVRALTDSLRTELKPFSVQCCLIEPFPCKTPIFDHIGPALDQTFDRSPESVTNAYGGEVLKKRLKQSFEKMASEARISKEVVGIHIGITNNYKLSLIKFVILLNRRWWMRSKTQFQIQNHKMNTGAAIGEVKCLHGLFYNCRQESGPCLQSIFNTL